MPTTYGTDAQKAALDLRSNNDASAGESDGHPPSPTPIPCISVQKRPCDGERAATATNLEVVPGDRGRPAAAPVQGLLIAALDLLMGSP